MEDGSVLSGTTSVYRRSPPLVSFHPDNSEPTDGEFNDIFNRHNTGTPWFILMFILSCLPTFCLETERATVEVIKTIEGNCVFPTLLKNNWTMHMISKFTQPERAKLCTYITFDYNKIATMSFLDAMEMKNNLTELPPTKLCAIPVTRGNYSWINPNFLKTCVSMNFRINAMSYRTLGEIVSTVIFAIVGDLWGRKMGLWITYPVLLLGLILNMTATNYYILRMAYFFEGFGHSAWSLLSYVLFLELCNPTVRGVLSVYLTCLGVLGKFFGYYVTFAASSYAVASLLCCIPSTTLLFYLFYMPESPRWLLSYGRKERAWSMLTGLNVDISGYKFLSIITLPKPKLFVDNLQILYCTKKYIKTLVGIGVLLAIEGILYQYKSGYIKLKELQIPAHRMILLLGDLFSFFNVLPPFIIFGRYISILAMHCFTLICLILNMALPNITTWFIINILILVSISSMQFVIFLYCCELIPTCVRAMGLGTTWIISRVVRIIIGYSVKWILGKKSSSVEIQNYLFFVIALIALLGIIILPHYRVHNLPDYKRYRNVIET